MTPEEGARSSPAGLMAPNKHMKRCSVSFVIREIKTTGRYHSTCVRVAKITKKTRVGKDVKTLAPSAYTTLLVGI